MKTFKYILYNIFFLMPFSMLLGQTTITIENFEKKLDAYIFDLYLNSENAQSNYFLGHSDFVLKLQNSSVQGASLEKVNRPDATGIQHGYCDFNGKDASGFAAQLLQMTYFNNTSCIVRDGKFIINVSSPTVTNEIALRQNAAYIDDREGTHRLGKFRVTGLKDDIQVEDIVLVTNAEMRISKVFQIEKSERYPQRRIANLYQGESSTVTSLPEINQGPVLDKGNFKLKVYPNPSTDFVNIHSGTDNDWLEEIQIVNQVGQIVSTYKRQGSANQYQIDIRAWPDGAYFVTVTGNDKQETLMFQKSE